MALLLFPGAEIADFRSRRLEAELRVALPRLEELRLREFFLIDCDEGVDRAALRQLLDAGDAEFTPRLGELYVVPRLGTLSPWASKATDIARVCGLAGVARIELGRAYRLIGVDSLPIELQTRLHDPMTESLVTEIAILNTLFDRPPPRPLREVDVTNGGREALVAANRDWGLALSGDEIDRLMAHFGASGRNPTDAELMMFAQVNSEHCRHKIFNAAFTLDGVAEASSPFDHIRASYKAAPTGVLSAYRDNAAVLAGPVANRWFPDHEGVWRGHIEPVAMLIKVETHNHPTGISPHPGAATGAGGEIRDEAATGRGGKPKAGLAGFTVANLDLPGFRQPWEGDDGRPPAMASALRIMIDGPLGAAAYNNEFGRPNLNGYFRSYSARTPDGRLRGYHKPVMIAGGYGNIRESHVEKKAVPVGARLVVLGGPALLIGLGGGAASSMASGASSAELDFASVQRANPELERRCQEVVDACWALGDANPILSIHDVGAGGLSNAFPELVDADGRGGAFRLRDIMSADGSLSPMELWCNEAQERYVLAVAAESLPVLEAFCHRERCPIYVVGDAVAERQLTVADTTGPLPVDLPMSVLLGKAPRLQRTASRESALFPPLPTASIDLEEAIGRLLRLPAIASKSFLITIGDRTVGGLTVRDQFVGPWQVPVADCAVTATAFDADTGEAMAMGERPLLALLNAPASGRMAVGEAITNLAAADVEKLSDIRLSCNWMAAAGSGDEDARLYDTVRAVGAELCPALGIAIPVGKDSLSMRSLWNRGGETQTQTAPLTLIVSAFAPVADVRRTLTPLLRTDVGDTLLLLVDLGGGRNRLGGSALAQVYGAVGEIAPDLDDPQLLIKAFATLADWRAAGRVLAYHDRSDGGLFVTLAEMAFATHCGLDIQVDGDVITELFSEELGMVVQLKSADVAAFKAALAGLRVLEVAAINASDAIRVVRSGETRFTAARADLFRSWSETSQHIAALRDEPGCVAEAGATLGGVAEPRISLDLRFTPSTAPQIKSRPRVAILREQGVNGQAEMAYAFHAAGFTPVDVHMSDIIEGRTALDDFAGLAACGGFSYGDVLGAGQGWAKSILFNARAREQFEGFFARPDRFALGVCNGCQMFAALRSLVPGSDHWPTFRRNRSQQFEARWTMVEVPESPSLFFAGMAGSRLPVAVAHGEGRAEFASDDDRLALARAGQVALQFVERRHYPGNPNGAPGGITGVCNNDGRITMLMPHPERTIHGATGSWWPQRWHRHTPWLELFVNARRWIG